MKDKIPCMICGKKLHEVTWSHLKSHGITLDEYKRKYSDAPLWSEIYRNKRVEGMKRACRENPRISQKRNEGSERYWSDPENRRKKSEEKLIFYSQTFVQGKCDLCEGEGEFIFKKHFEEHLVPPRELDICVTCHLHLHRLFRVTYPKPHVA